MNIGIRTPVRALVLGSMIPVLYILPLSNNARAQDQIGIFFDENAGSSLINTTELNQEVSAFVTVLLPSHEEGISYFDVIVNVTGSAGTGIEPYGGCVNGFAPYPVLNVFCDTPLVGTSHIVFAEYIIQVASPSSYIGIFIVGPGGIGGFGPLYRLTGSTEEIFLVPESGDFSLPLAEINGSVSNESVGWGGAKALYR